MDNMLTTHANRRRFLRTLGGGLTLIPLMQLVGCSGEESTQAAPSPPAAAAPQPPEPASTTTEAEVEAEVEPAAESSDLPRLSEDDPAAQALGYRHDAADVDASSHPRFESGQNCANCSLFMGGDDSRWAGCPIFRGKLVNADGWCTSWVAKS